MWCKRQKADDQATYLAGDLSVDRAGFIGRRRLIVRPKRLAVWLRLANATVGILALLEWDRFAVNRVGLAFCFDSGGLLPDFARRQVVSYGANITW